MSRTLYFVTNQGEILEYTEVPQEQWGNMRPQDGCDLLIRRPIVGIASAKSEFYHESPEEAASQFIENTARYAQELSKRLSDELNAIRNCQRNLGYLPTFKGENHELENA